MKLSIITINFNNAAGLEKTIQSVVSQDCDDFEYIVIDGGSTDGSVEIIKKHSDRIAYWVSELDKGIYHAMNKGVAQAHSDYCIFMNSGDCFYDKNTLHKLLPFCDDVDIAVGKVFDSKTGRQWFTHPDAPISMYYLYSGTIAHQGAVIKTSLLIKYPYDETLKIVSDWKFWVQSIILHNCSVQFVDIPVALFDTEGVSTSNKDITWQEKESVLSAMFPKRILADYERMKQSECLTQALTPQLRQSYRLDKFLYRIGRCLLKWRKRHEE